MGHADILYSKRGMITNEKRCYGHIVESTLEFIDKFNDSMRLKIIDKYIIVNFDGTIKNGSLFVFIVIRYKQDSTDRNNNVV